MGKYKHRIADELLRDNLEAAGLVLIEGTKWCGKTTTAEQQAGSVVYINDPEHLQTYISLAQTAPKLLLKGKTPRLVDKWQDAPELWDAARYEADHRDVKTGQFIFTGSTVIPKEKREKIKHSGTGRVARVTMRPMSLWESGESNGSLSFASLFEGKIEEAYPTNELGIEELAWLICRGGWPAALSMSAKGALKKLFVIEDSPAWNPNLRSRTAIRTSDTRYYVDSSIKIILFDGFAKGKDLKIKDIAIYERIPISQLPETYIVRVIPYPVASDMAMGVKESVPLIKFEEDSVNKNRG